MRARKPTEVLLERTRFEARPKDGGGVLSFEAWGFEKDGKTVVTRYSMAYINRALFRCDNVRVLGYDNAHDEHHLHYMGKTERIEFESYEALVTRFQSEWRQVARRPRRKG